MVKGKEPWKEKNNNGRGEKVMAHEKEKVQGEGAMAQGRERVQGEGVMAKGEKPWRKRNQWHREITMAKGRK